MVNISSTNNAIYKPVGKFMNHTATKWLNKTLDKARKEPAKYAARLVVLSFVSKDLINTCIYTYQSLNNKKIPEEKRSFVAANDLVLGFFNFAGQILMAKLFEKHVTPLIEGKKYTGYMKDSKEVAQYKHPGAPMSPDNINKYTREAIKEKQGELKTIKLENSDAIAEQMIKKLGGTSSKGKAVAAGLGIVVTMLATTAFIKRTVSPLFSTPIAGWLGDKWDKARAQKQNADQMLLDLNGTTLSYTGSKDDKLINKNVPNK